MHSPTTVIPAGRSTGAGAIEQTLCRVRAAGVDLDAITTQLEREGVESFCRSYGELLDCIERKLDWVQVEA